MPDQPNLLFYGDNLDVLRRHIKDESVDLVYHGPPFKSDQRCDVLSAADGSTRARVCSGPEEARMAMRAALLILLGSACAPGILAAQPGARHLPSPQTYSVTQVTTLMLSAEGTGSARITMKIARDGRYASVERTFDPQPGMSRGQHMRTLYDLQTHRDWTWDLSDSASSNPCGLATFGGAWGDPFAGAAEMTADILKQHPRVLGHETLNGMATTAMQTADPAGHGDMKVWLDDRYGLLVRLDRPGSDGQRKTVLEIKEMSLEKPPASLLVPPACPGEPSAPPPTEAERLAAAAGGNPGDFADARMAPPSSRRLRGPPRGADRRNGTGLALARPCPTIGCRSPSFVSCHGPGWS